MSLIQLDWLHIADIGVALHWLGSVFTILAEKLPSATIDQRCKKMHLRMKQYYQDFAVDSRLPLFKVSMLQKKHKQIQDSQISQIESEGWRSQRFDFVCFATAPRIAQPK